LVNLSSSIAAGCCGPEIIGSSSYRVLFRLQA
jgi:hypothetical protein